MFETRQFSVRAFQWDDIRPPMTDPFFKEMVLDGRIIRDGELLLVGESHVPAHDGDWVVDLYGGGSLVVFPSKVFYALFVSDFPQSISGGATQQLTR